MKLSNAILLTSLALVLTACGDKPNDPTKENFTKALDSVLNKEEVKIVGPGMLVNSDKNLFAIEDPHAKKNADKQYKVKDVKLLDSLISYAKIFEKAGAVEIKETTYEFPKLFGGTETKLGYVITYNDELLKTMQVVPFIDLPIVKAGVLCVDKITGFTTPASENGVNVSKVTFTKGVCKHTKGIDDKVIASSGILDALNESSTYTLKQTDKGWEVIDEELFKIDYVKYFFNKNL